MSQNVSAISNNDVDYYGGFLCVGRLFFFFLDTVCDVTIPEELIYQRRRKHRHQFVFTQAQDRRPNATRQVQFEPSGLVINSL